MKIDELVKQQTIKAIKALYNADVEGDKIQVSQTKKEFVGDLTVVMFPLLKISKKNPEETGNELGSYLAQEVAEIDNFNVIKGFLNVSISKSYWLGQLNSFLATDNFGFKSVTPQSSTVMVEYSSPNTNKPLHLGHIRNNLLGYSIAKILEANGHNVIKANLVNDRGIHICKSMIAWQLFGNGETPQSSGIKGDALVGKYYVAFDKEYKREIDQYVTENKASHPKLADIQDIKAARKNLESRKDDKSNPLNDEDKQLLKAIETLSEAAEQNAPIMQQAREMLRRWEAGDKATLDLWQTMNGWVYAGFDVTYKKLGVSFDKMYYESQTYLLGKSVVEEGLRTGVLYKEADGSVWCDLTPQGLDKKLLLRPDGTSVYMTQDLGTAVNRFNEFGNMDELIYVVGNEQNYHFQVLKLIMNKLGYGWADKIYHMSYGMVELPEGKMKSREGTVVDADELIDEMVRTSEQISRDLGKLDGMSDEEARQLFEMLALGALKYFILKVEPKKTMMFNPAESIDFNGNTGPFIQYTHARICSLCRKAEAEGLSIPRNVDTSITIGDKEQDLMKCISLYPSIVEEAGQNHSPAVIANYVYELVKYYNQFYHDCPVLKEENVDVRGMRIALSMMVGRIIKSGMLLLGINVPTRM